MWLSVGGMERTFIHAMHASLAVKMLVDMYLNVVVRSMD